MEILNRMNPSEAGSITTKYITYNKTFHVITAVSPFFFPGSNTPPPFFPQVNYNIGMTAFSKRQHSGHVSFQVIGMKTANDHDKVLVKPRMLYNKSSVSYSTCYYLKWQIKPRIRIFPTLAQEIPGYSLCKGSPMANYWRTGLHILGFSLMKWGANFPSSQLFADIKFPENSANDPVQIMK